MLLQVIYIFSILQITELGLTNFNVLTIFFFYFKTTMQQNYNFKEFKNNSKMLVV